MKKITSIAIAISLLLSLTAVTASASSADPSSAQQVVSMLGIITGDGSGDLNLSGNVTRAQFAKMMIAASTYKDTVSKTSNVSPFKDVKYTNWAASFIQAAVSAGWLTGYSDGTFRPDNNLTLEEAVSALLKMLGYTTSDFAGAFPEAQLAKYAALGMNSNITKMQGQLLSRQDCMNLFYNLMSVKNKSGSYYASTLGYTVDSSGNISYSSLMLANMTGPFIADDANWSSALPFTASTATVYLNGMKSSLSSVENYDVYYYNAAMNTIWVYRNQVSGVYTAASPSTSAPTSVTVAGKTYSIAASSAAYALSNLGTFGVGSTVTLLLDMNGNVAGAVKTSIINTVKYGFITATGTETYTDSSGNSCSTETITLYCTDGSSYKYECDNSGLNIGDMVKVSFSNDKAVVAGLVQTGLSGTVNSAATSLGSYTFADNVEILDTTGNGSYIKIFASRLAGLSLSSGQILYYALDSSGKISNLILENVTGDMYSYGVVTSSTETHGSLSVVGSYKYMLNGNVTSYNINNKAFGVAVGPALFEFNGSSIVQMKNLTSLKLSSLTSSAAVSDGVQYKLGDNVPVYIYKNGSYNLSNIATVSGMSNCTLYGYYDKPESSGGRIRVIIADAG